jgi:hypothetical protein
MASKEAHSEVGSQDSYVIEGKRWLIKTYEWQLLVDISTHLCTTHIVVHTRIHWYWTLEQRIPSLASTIDSTLAEEHTCVDLRNDDKAFLDNRDIAFEADNDRTELEALDAVRREDSISPGKIDATLHTARWEAILV